MARLVMKFGGTSVATTELMDRIAQRVSGLRNEGHEVVLVVSAMGHETDRLVDLAEQVDFQDPAGRQELDVLLSTGEQVSIALLALSLMKAGVSARSFQGHQIPIHTDAAYSRARILSIETQALEQSLSLGIVPVVAGFQGVSDDRRVTTLGRGGSDTTAVALAAALSADEC